MAEFTVPGDPEFAAITRRTKRRMARQLLADRLGSPVMTRAVARANASRANGRLGGRPKSTKAA
jgi:hypothetical protein